jgi:hypothetical protein
MFSFELGRGRFQDIGRLRARWRRRSSLVGGSAEFRQKTAVKKIFPFFFDSIVRIRFSILRKLIRSRFIAITVAVDPA